MATGAGAFLTRPIVRSVLGIVSMALLLTLAFIFSIAAVKTAVHRKQAQPILDPKSKDNVRTGGYLLGFLLALSSPWNIGFWLAVVGTQQALARSHAYLNSIGLAGAVVLGALTWTIVLSLAVRSGAKIFSGPLWQIWTQALTAAVMLYFAAKLGLQLWG